jgi:sugar transferase (PEP-CTERM system associated)
VIRVFDRYISRKSVTLAVVESGLIALALLCGARLRFWQNDLGFQTYITGPEFLSQALTFVAIVQICFYYCDLYNLAAIRLPNDRFIAVGQSLGSACLLLGMLYFVFPNLVLGRGVFFISVALLPAFILVNRVALDRIWRAAAPAQNVLVLGTGKLASVVASTLAQRPDLNIRVVGFAATPDLNGVGGTMAGLPVLGTTEQVAEIVQRNGVGRIVVALEDRRNGALPIQHLVRLRVEGIQVEEAHSAISALTGRVWLDTVKPSWFVFSDGFQRSAWTLVVKRALDLACGLIGVVVTFPAMLLVALAIRLDSKGPIFYRQTRVGLRGRPFQVIKFRSMRIDAEESGRAKWAVTNDPRVTRVGRFLRKYRVDELPQFINVIRGEMSFVGPRPERPVFVKELRKQISYYDERHTVRPGVTGWAQVQYEYGSSVEDAARKMEYDLFYLKNMSVAFDLAIIFDTVRIVLTGQGGK